ncbi:glycosyltransferase [Nocardioides sp.]|uniref:glycosyltransferase n=1 Tax=Nocardioides sp. TaxID=35761 RepID=UPI0031FEE54E|nr:glycosyl transferase family 2 [Nocardioides sp.]
MSERFSAVTALVVALTGTDHHPFERMVRWVDAAAVRHRDVHFLIQHGAARPPLVAEGHEFLGHDHLVALLSEALVVVCHGGPGTIMEAREAGHVPLCLPRDPRLGEHVDGHQQRFAAVVGAAGVVRAIATLDTFDHELADALARAPGSGAVTTTRLDRDAARARAASELDDLVSLRPHRPGRPHRTSL